MEIPQIQKMQFKKKNSKFEKFHSPNFHKKLCFKTPFLYLKHSK
jgi:hypothetical protein